MEYYDEATLDKIADELGKRLKVDNKTVISARGSYARIYVELDLSKPLEPSVAVGKFDYMLEYEHIHLICFSCGRVGHRKEASLVFEMGFLMCIVKGLTLINPNCLLVLICCRKIKIHF